MENLNITMNQSSQPSTKDILDAIERIEKNPNDRMRMMSELGVAGVGAAGAGAAASIIGASTFSLLGIGVTVAAAPFALVAGSIAAGGVATYGLAKLVTGGGRQEGKQQEIKTKLKEKLSKLNAQEQKKSLTTDKKSQFISALKKPLEMDIITSDQAHQLITLVENGQMSTEEANVLLKDLISAS